MFALSKELKDQVNRKSSVFYRIFKNCLKVKEENVLIISDFGTDNSKVSSMLGYGYYNIAKNKGYNVQIMFQESKKGFMQADNHIIRALNNLSKKSIVIATVSNKLGRIGDKKSFRGFCKEKGHRFISATGLGDAKNNHFEQFMEAMNVNYSRMKKIGNKLKRKLDKAKKIQVKTDAGTNIIFDVEGMESKANLGEYNEEGMGGNVPAGEIYIPPKGYYGVNGTIVIDGSMKTSNGAVLIDEPVTLKIVEGRVVSIEGKHAHLLEKTFNRYENRSKYPYRVRHVGELGIGINPGAVLIGSTIMDEKVLGTAHIGIGSNYWFGGDIKTVYHGDQVFKNPRIYLDGELLKL
jgi:hypothetical protein